MPIDKEILIPYKRKIFIETGTRIGEGIDTALSVGFEKIYSIEWDIDLYSICSERFSQSKNIGLINGDSRESFPILMKKIKEPATIWLDAHSPQLSTLIEELRALIKHSIKEHIIIIDDIRLFKKHYWKNLPTYEKIIEMIKKINPKYKIKLIDSTKFDEDILVAEVE